MEGHLFTDSQILALSIDIKKFNFLLFDPFLSVGKVPEFFASFRILVFPFPPISFFLPERPPGIL